ncbi:hypothetical protein M0805_003936 [Coniferiporia weirii]|nr:hypothetical protein M0805_003936 [Coniferiporia weirii]
MPSSILNLKFKGNKSFVAFSNLGDSDSLTKTWKVCTKVASYLEQGQRLENLSWRLWHLQNLMVETDNARSKREFKKLSKVMGDKLDKEKGRAIEELEAPDFKLNHAAEKLRQRAEEKERSRFEAATQGGIGRPLNRMQFTFAVDQPAGQLGEAGPVSVKKPDLKPSTQFRDTIQRRTRPTTRASVNTNAQARLATSGDDRGPPEGNDKDPPTLTSIGRKPSPPPTAQDTTSADAYNAYGQTWNDSSMALRFPTLFTNDFGPAALLFPQPSLVTALSYGEDASFRGASDNQFQISRPTIELPLDEILRDVARSDSPGSTDSSIGGYAPDDVEMGEGMHMSDPCVPPMSRSAREALPDTIHPAQVTPPPVTSSPPPVTPARTAKPTLTVKTNARTSGPSATATSATTPSALQGNSSTAPGGVKSECSNCGATHTPLWRRGLNDELNCNACGLYCKLHKRPRPKSMRNQHGEGRHQAAPRTDNSDSLAQCYNCHTMATPLWRKDDEGKTVCNAFKLHGSARPISMKSDIIRKRSRHDARRMGSGETPSASPGASRRASPTANQQRSPTLAPDSSTAQPAYNYSQEDYDFAGQQSELLNALGTDMNNTGVFSSTGHFDNSLVYNHSFPGPYHPDHLQQRPYGGPYTDGSDGTSNGSSDEDRMNKRRRMSVDSASGPPSSAASYSSYATEASSATSRSSLDYNASYAYPTFAPGGTMRAGAFWHPPMLPQSQDKSPATFVHPPMLPADELPMDFLHPPMVPMQDDRDLFASYLHPPMVVGGEDSPMAQLSALHPHPPMVSGEYYGQQGQQQQHQQAQQQQQKQEQALAHSNYYEHFGSVN